MGCFVLCVNHTVLINTSNTHNYKAVAILPFYHYFTVMTESTTGVDYVGDHSHIQASVAPHSPHILFDKVL